MIYKLTSIKSLLRHTISMFGLGDTEVPWQDMIEWTARGLEHIGSYSQFETKECELEVEGYRAKLPFDFHELIRIINCGARLHTNPAFIGDAEKNSVTERDININHDNIQVAFEEGTLTIQYLALPIDCDGFPLIPDHPSYFDALAWRIAYHLAIRGQLPNKELNVEYCRRMWNRYCGQARTEGYMPNMDMMDRMAKQFNKLKYSKHEYDRLFSGLGQTSQRTNGRI